MENKAAVIYDAKYYVKNGKQYLKNRTWVNDKTEAECFSYKNALIKKEFINMRHRRHGEYVEVSLEPIEK